MLNEKNHTESGSPKYKFEIITPTPMEKLVFTRLNVIKL